MSYMVMECHLSYAVVLDEDGRFLKVANRNYEVGQKVTDVIEMQIPRKSGLTALRNKWVYSMVAAAACLVLVFTSVLQMNRITYASVYMSINPEVRIDVNRKDVVVGLNGVNEDGKNLIEGYDFQKKSLDTVMEELVDRAVEQGYLYEGGKISLRLDAKNEQWVVDHSDFLASHLQNHLKETVTVTVGDSDREESSTEPSNQKVVIPVSPEDDGYGESDYDQTEASTRETSTRMGDRDDGDSSGKNGESDYEDEEAVSPYDSEEESDYDTLKSGKDDEDDDDDQGEKGDDDDDDRDDDDEDDDDDDDDDDDEKDDDDDDGDEKDEDEEDDDD